MASKSSVSLSTNASPAIGLEDIFQKLVDLFMEQKYYRLFQLSILKKPLRLAHLEEVQKTCSERDFQKQLKSEENENSVKEAENDVQSTINANVPGALDQFENFQKHRTSNQIVYCKLLHFGCLLNEDNEITEFSVSESDVENDLRWIIKRFVAHYNIRVLKLESARFVTLPSGCEGFLNQLIGLYLSELSLDGSRLQGCDLSSLFQIQAKEISLRFCSLEDADILSFAESLAECGSLKMLNLNFNWLSDNGCKYLAQYLRLNRTLNCLSLMRNLVGDTGCRYILEILKTFPLTREELLKLRKIKLDQYVAKLNNLPAEDKRQKIKFSSTSGSQSKKTDAELKVSKKSRMLPPPVARNKDYGSYVPADIQKVEGIRREKLLYETCVGRENGVGDTRTSCTIKSGKVFCDGNFSLTHLYLAQNNLTPNIIPDVLEVLDSQEDLHLDRGKGLVHLTISH